MQSADVSRETCRHMNVEAVSQQLASIFQDLKALQQGLAPDPKLGPLEQTGKHLALIEEFSNRFRETAQLLERVAGELDQLRAQAVDALLGVEPRRQ
jgi:hypothetical protein